MSEKRIDPEAFAQRFRKAVEASIGFAATMVRQTLPESWRFVVEPRRRGSGVLEASAHGVC